jgi:NTP pyrophosphatase (non-canonical NTP hydrolase)
MSYPQDRETANDYQDYVVKYSQSYDIYGTPNALPVYSNGLAEEVGEISEVFDEAVKADLFRKMSKESGHVSGLIKRHFRGDTINPEEFKKKLTLELGDVIAYAALIAHTFNIRLDDVLQANLRKAAKRNAEKTQLGSGSDR